MCKLMCIHQRYMFEDSTWVTPFNDHSIFALTVSDPAFVRNHTNESIAINHAIDSHNVAALGKL